MLLPKELSDAYAAINKHIDEAVAGLCNPATMRIELNKLSKKELIEQIIEMKSTVKGKRPVNVESLMYNILGDPACAFLTYDMIATAVQSREIPGVKTTAGNLRWYASKSIEKDRDVVPRATKSAIQSLIAKACRG
jgi:hypothetical protein